MSKKVLLAVFCAAVLLYLGNKVYADEHKPEGNGLASDSQSHKFIGVSKCKICHMSDSKGNQHKKWLDSKHAKAYETLASEEAKKTAERVGLKADPQKSPECLKCHVTGYEAKTELKEESFNMADGVQCESCHGAGSDYKSLSVMKDKQKSIEAGLIIPDEKTCVKCHNTESPNFPGFEYKTMWEKISHMMPRS